MSAHSEYTVRFHFHPLNVDYAEWISVLTVCLAPLIIHILAGAPSPVYLDTSRPRWHEKVVHYNPTSIVWRYFAIFDRRLRVQKWTDVDAAASSSLFWTQNGWDGSEQMMVECRGHYVRNPSSKLERVFSTDTLKTIVITLQGAQAFGTLVGNWEYSLITIFMPFAVIGLLRIPAASWLTDDRLFVDKGSSHGPKSAVGLDDSPEANVDSTTPLTSKTGVISTTSHLPLDPSAPVKLHPVASFRGITVRVFYIGFLLGLIVVWVLQSFPLVFSKKQGVRTFAISGVLLTSFYGLFIVLSILVYLFYFIFRRSSPSNTVIPCITQMWYKAYTGILLAMMVVMVIIAGLETRKTPCGVYTFSDSQFDYEVCPATCLGS